MKGSKIPIAATPESGSLSLQKINSSSVSSSIAEFIPMRSIMKPNVATVTSLNGATAQVTDNQKKYKHREDGRKSKKVVRFDDMILIDAEQAQIFLSDEEASIIEKKATPTKLNLQSSAELRKKIRK